MAEKVTMPKLGFDMAEGTLIRWLKQEGESVAKGEILAEIETDKATVEVESPYNGVMSKHLVENGTVVPVGTDIAVITAPGERMEEAKEGQFEPIPQEAPKESAEPRITPKPEVEEKAEEKPPEQPAERPVPYQAAAEAGPAKPVEERQVPSDGGPQEMVRASPLARRLAEERGLDLKRVTGTGPGGRIVKKDIEQAEVQPAAPAPTAAPPAAPAPRPAAAPEVQPVAWVPPAQIPADETVALDRLRQAIGRRMVESRQQVPHFYVTSEYNVEALLNMRKQVNEQMPEDQKLTVNDFIVKAVALTLRQFPNVNASLQGDHILRHGHVNVGIAVSVPGGLLTVVTRDTDQKPLRMLSAEIAAMVARVRSGKVRSEDIEGSTFSVSNLGMYGVEDFVAIINPPEAAILAVGAAKQAPVVVDGQLKVGVRMKATLSADHRVTDGAEGAQFMQALTQFLENPVRLLI